MFPMLWSGGPQGAQADPAVFVRLAITERRTLVIDERRDLDVVERRTLELVER